MTAFVDVGGYMLAADVTAGGMPPIVFVSGIGERRDSWRHALPCLQSANTTVAYDRAGIGQKPASADRRHTPALQRAGG